MRRRPCAGAPFALAARCALRSPAARRSRRARRGQDGGEAGLAPYGIHEDCADLAAGDRLDYRFESTTPVKFNIHYHEGGMVLMPITRDDVTSDSGVFAPRIKQSYCLMWEAGAAGAIIAYRMQVRGPRAVIRARTLLFDLDGTLTDNYAGIAASIRHALECLGAARPADAALRGCVGPPLRESFARLLGTTDAPLIERAVAHYRERFADVGWKENVAYAGVGDALVGARGNRRANVCLHGQAGDVRAAHRRRISASRRTFAPSTAPTSRAASTTSPR